MEEIIKGFKYHSISKEGVVKNNKTNFIKKNWLCGNGYFYVDIQEDCVVKKCPIHRLLAIQFIPNPENKRTVNHKDGNKLNNSLDNLEWATDSENISHAYSIGLNNKKNKFLNEKDLKIYLDLFFEGNNLTKLASISNLKLSQFSIRLKKFAKENNLLDEYLNELKQQKIKRQSKV